MSPSSTCEQFMESPRDLAEYFYCHTHFTEWLTPEETLLNPDPREALCVVASGALRAGA